MSSKKILLVDDNKGQRLTLESILKKSGFEVMSADCGMSALSVSENQDFAAALLDIKMPDITGIEVLKELKTRNSDTMVIMMTGYSEAEYAVEALNAGASAYLLKPANIEQIKVLLNTAIEYQRVLEENRAMSNALKEWNEELERKVELRTRQLTQSYRLTQNFYEELKKNFESTLEVLSIAIDQRDHLTSSHSFRVTQYALEIGKQLNFRPEDLETLRYAGLLHDLGKIEIKEHILCKNGSLTSEEYKEIQTHASGTFDLLSKFKFKHHLSEVPMIASSHHERFDGQGYPRKLKGTDIPFLARVLAVADVLDAITSKRHYRTAMPIDEALMIMKRESGGHFDPTCIEALYKMKVSDFLQIHMADHLDRLNPTDLINLGQTTLDDFLKVVQKDEASPEEITQVQYLYNYYQGPVPARFKDKVTPFSEPPKE